MPSSPNTTTEETTSLLSSSSHVDDETEPNQVPQKGPSQTLIIALLQLYLVFLDLGYELIVPAQTRVFETIYCKQYYEKHNTSLIGSDGADGVDEKWCKVSAVQGKVSMLKGWQLTFDSIGMLMFSIPWAYLADLRGRKPVMLLLTMGLLIKYVYVQLICYLGGALPLEMTWLSALHTVMGGSVTVATALIYTVISDVVSKAERIAKFFGIMAINIATQFFGSLISAILMGYNPWIPMLLGLTVELISVLVLLLIPETLNYRDGLSPNSGSPSMSTGISPQHQPWWRKLLGDARSCISFLVSEIRVVLIVSAFIIHMLFLNRDVLLLYISSRYRITLAHATVLISVRSGLIFILCVIILPIVNLFCRSRLGPKRSDLLLSRTSAAIIALSFLGIGLATNVLLLSLALVFNSLGWGLFSFLRSLAISLVETEYVARLNTLIGIFDTVGLMVGSPLLAILFTRGLEVGGLWVGLPFFFCAGIVALLTFMLAGITV